MEEWRYTKIPMFRLVTIEREFGSGAASIASQLAERLGWKLWDHLLTEEIARIAQVDPSAVKRCGRQVRPEYHGGSRSAGNGSGVKNGDFRFGTRRISERETG